MTVVAAVARDGVVTMAADTAIDYHGTYLLGFPKVRRLELGAHRSILRADPGVGTALLAASGDGAMLGALQRHLHIDDVPDRADITGVSEWADTVAAAATQILAEQTPPIIETQSGRQGIDGALLLGWAGHLFYLFTHQAHRCADGVGVLGSGCDIAFGAVHTALRAGGQPRTAVLQAVMLACDHCGGCRVDDRGPLIGTLTQDMSYLGFAGVVDASTESRDGD